MEIWKLDELDTMMAAGDVWMVCYTLLHSVFIV